MSAEGDDRQRVRALLREALELDGNDEFPHALTDAIEAFLATPSEAEPQAGEPASTSASGRDHEGGNPRALVTSPSPGDDIAPSETGSASLGVRLREIEAEWNACAAEWGALAATAQMARALAATEARLREALDASEVTVATVNGKPAPEGLTIPARVAIDALDDELAARLRLLADAVADAERLRDALEKAADTFADLRAGLALIGHPTTAYACAIAERFCRDEAAVPADDGEPRRSRA